jgi:hypothetical protein
MHRLRASLCLLPLLLSVSCAGVHTLADATLTLRTKGGSELGVSTDYGIVFLGHTAVAGPVEVTAWFGDGPDIEKTVIEPVTGHVIYTAETEITLPHVPMTFDDPKPGSEVLLIGRNNRELWQVYVKVEQDPHVIGIITSVPHQLRNAEDQIGTGVYVVPDGDERRRMLVGLVSGRVKIESTGAEYLTIVGPTELWRLVSHRREPRDLKRWVYREDIL